MSSLQDALRDQGSLWGGGGHAQVTSDSHRHCLCHAPRVAEFLPHNLKACSSCCIATASFLQKQFLSQTESECSVSYHSWSNLAKLTSKYGRAVSHKDPDLPYLLASDLTVCLFPSPSLQLWLQNPQQPDLLFSGFPPVPDQTRTSCTTSSYMRPPTSLLLHSSPASHCLTNLASLAAYPAQ